MSVQNPKECYSGRVVIEPAGVIKERQLASLAPSCEIPTGAIVCYDAALWQWVTSLKGATECDGWLAGAYLLPRGGSYVLAMKAAGFGAPTAVMTLEELIASGVTRFVSLGAAGGLQEDLGIGDIIICDRAIRDEGTSHHYLPPDHFAHACPELTTSLVAALEGKGLPVRRGTSWTTDALYRETVEDLRRYRDAGTATVEMEAAALFAVGTYRGVSVSSIFTISDLVSENGWHQQYHSEDKRAGMKQIFDAALDAISN
jgi:uridine phosphorylase